MTQNILFKAVGPSPPAPTRPAIAPAGRGRGRGRLMDVRPSWTTTCPTRVPETPLGSSDYGRECRSACWEADAVESWEAVRSLLNSKHRSHDKFCVAIVIDALLQVALPRGGDGGEGEGLVGDVYDDAVLQGQRVWPGALVTAGAGTGTETTLALARSSRRCHQCS